MIIIKVRLETLEFNDEERRAIRFALKKRRTPATRDEVREWGEEVLALELKKVLHRWNGDDNSTVDPDLANHISEEKNETEGVVASEPVTPNYL